MSAADHNTSPCIGVCAMNEASGLCHGCYRTLDEIREWWDMPPERKQTVRAALEQRMVEHADFGG